MKENIRKFRFGQHNYEDCGVISVVTNVIYPDDNGNNTGMHIVEYGASFCSPTERQYNKKFGYQLAESRLQTSGEKYTGRFVIKHLTHDIVRLNVFFKLALDPDVPSWGLFTIYRAIYEGMMNL